MAMVRSYGGDALEVNLLAVGEDELDLERFERYLRDGRRALAERRPEEASPLLGEALSPWRGPALAEFSEPFARLEAARLEERRLACLEERLEADLVAVISPWRIRAAWGYEVGS